MKILEKYSPEKTYMYPSGEIATGDRIAADFPAVTIFPHIIETDESRQVCYAVQNLGAMRSYYDIDSALSDDEAIAAMQEILNAKPVVETNDTPSAEERIAAALEYQNLMNS